MTNPLESIPGNQSGNDIEKSAAKKALGVFDESEVGNKILENPALVEVLEQAAKLGQTVSPGFYGDIKRVDPGLANEFLNDLAKKDILPKTQVDQVVTRAGVDAETALSMHRFNIASSRERSFMEREKTVEEEVMIDRAGKNVNDLRAKYGLPPVEFSPERVKMNEQYARSIDADGKKLLGGYHHTETEIIYKRSKELARFNIIQHELLHGGSHQGIKVVDNGESTDPYRVGLETRSLRKNESGQEETFLVPLNEALTEENARRITMAISKDDPELGELVAKRDESLEVMEMIRARGNQVLPAEVLQKELYYADVDWENKKLDVQQAAYYDERQAMWQLFDKIHEKNPAAFPGKSREEAREVMFDMATKAMLDGNIMPLGRLMNDTFGRGTFRQYGHLQTPQEIVTLIDSLDKVGGLKEEKPKTEGEENK